MRCPFCGHTDTQVKDSRPSDDGRTIRRRRECTACNRRFTTFETFQVQQIIVLKQDGHRELFSREKLSRSLMLALNKRPVKPAVVSDLVADFEQSLAEGGKSEVTSREIGEFVLSKLKELDFVAYIRYASVYNAFENTQDFEKLLKQAK